MIGGLGFDEFTGENGHVDDVRYSQLIGESSGI